MKSPHYLAIAAVTIDGKIAKNAHHMSDWTSKEDKKFMRALLDQCDVILVGNNTYQTARRPLSKRNCLVLTGKIKATARKSKNLLYCNPQKIDINKLIRQLKYKQVAVLGGAQTYAYCLKHNLLDELYLTIEPFVFGQGIGLLSGDEPLHKKFLLKSITKLNKRGSLLLRYKTV